MDPRLLPRITELPPQTAGQTIQPNERMNLLFITQTSNSLIPRASPEVRREIASRARQNAFAQRRYAREIEASEKAKAPPKRLFGDFQRHQQNDSEPDSHEQDWPQVTSLTTAVSPSGHDRSLSVRSYLDSSQADPFSTGTVPMTAEMQSVFMWYFNVILPVVEPTQSEREDYSRWAVPLLSTEPALLYSLLTCMAHDIEQATVVGFGPSSRRNMTEQRLQYRVRAIKELNVALANSEAAVKPSTLLAVHFLLWQEVSAFLMDH